MYDIGGQTSIPYQDRMGSVSKDVEHRFFFGGADRIVCLLSFHGSVGFDRLL